MTSASEATLVEIRSRSEAPVSPGTLRAAALRTSGVVSRATLVASIRASVSALVPALVVAVESATIRAVAR
jgi:hypothetical protein